MSEYRCRRCGAYHNGSHTCNGTGNWEYIDRNVFDEICRQNAELQAELARLQSERRWIPVSERLPEFHQDVLVCDECKDIYNTTFGVANYPNKGDLWFLDFDHEITHWMPLPCPPDGDA